MEEFYQANPNKGGKDKTKTAFRSFIFGSKERGFVRFRVGKWNRTIKTCGTIEK